jgi:hypothetical protein
MRALGAQWAKNLSMEETMTFDKLTRRDDVRRQRLIGLPAFGVAESAEAQNAKGKTVECITFGLSSNIKSRFLDGVKKRAADARSVLHIIDGRGDKTPDPLLINRPTRNCWWPASSAAMKAKIPVFIIEKPPTEGDYLSIVDFDNVTAAPWAPTNWRARSAVRASSSRRAARPARHRPSRATRASTTG